MKTAAGAQKTWDFLPWALGLHAVLHTRSSRLSLHQGSLAFRCSERGVSWGQTGEWAVKHAFLHCLFISVGIRVLCRSHLHTKVPMPESSFGCYGRNWISGSINFTRQPPRNHPRIWMSYLSFQQPVWLPQESWLMSLGSCYSFTFRVTLWRLRHLYTQLSVWFFSNNMSFNSNKHQLSKHTLRSLL